MRLQSALVLASLAMLTIALAWWTMVHITSGTAQLEDYAILVPGVGALVWIAVEWSRHVERHRRND